MSMRAEPRDPSSGGRVHGGPQDEELRALGIQPAQLLDFSVSTNPYGPCPGVLEAIRAAPIDRYPDPTGRAAREVMAASLSTPADEIVLGNGAAELLWALARALLRPGDGVLVVEPTFCEFRAAAQAVGARIAEWRAHEGDGFAIDLPAITRVMRAERAGVVYLCAPNTPTGTVVPASEIARWAEDDPLVSVVLDQSFLSLSERSGDAEVRMPANVIRVRSLTKEHAIPGVRLGYLLADARVVALVERQRPAWMTSSMALAAAMAACREREFVDRSRHRILAEREQLAGQIERLGLSTIRSTTGFFLARTAHAAALRRRLLARHHILIRDCASFGLPDFVRLSVRPVPEVERLLAALREELPRC
jgi:histidinol-phosphate/aromatic aminotransferase/cobyric acid decarboxylase-like protein